MLDGTEYWKYKYKMVSNCFIDSFQGDLLCHNLQFKIMLLNWYSAFLQLVSSFSV